MKKSGLVSAAPRLLPTLNQCKGSTLGGSTKWHGLEAHGLEHPGRRPGRRNAV
jgi:hypothetical protein